MRKPFPHVKLLRDFPTRLSPCVATIGNFDGLHIAHRKIVEQLVQKAKVLKLPAAIITFEPLPQTFLRPEQSLLRLTSLRQKVELLAEWGVARIICLRFNAAFSRLSPQEFIENILVKRLNVKHMIVGEDFRFGFKQSGNVALLQHEAKQFDMVVEPLAIMQTEDRKISSTLIRQYLLQGDLPRVNALLGRPFSIGAHIVVGDKRGRTLGFPTANLPLKKDQTLFKGVFVTQQMIDQQKYYGVANVGTRPTVDGKHPWVEVHLLNYSGNLYGKRLKVEFLRKIRDEQRFANVDELQQQIHRDIEAAKECIAI
ncbi:MAG: bifunctional riboflavin kinase/FAD synthetase [Candidatus Berkiellales bacterium]